MRKRNKTPISWQKIGKEQKNTREKRELYRVIIRVLPKIALEYIETELKTKYGMRKYSNENVVFRRQHLEGLYDNLDTEKKRSFLENLLDDEIYEYLHYVKPTNRNRIYNEFHDYRNTHLNDININDW